MKEFMSFSDIEIIAYHEAGHVVLNIINGITFNIVTIISDGDYDGAVHGSWKFPNEDDENYEFGPELIKSVEKHVRACYGGMIAEIKLTGYIKDQSVYESDRIAVYRWANSICSGPEHLQKLCDRLYKEAELTFTNENGEDTIYWKCLKSIALGLIEKKTLSYNEAKAIYDSIISASAK